MTFDFAEMTIRENSKKPPDLHIDDGRAWLRERIEVKLLHGKNIIITAPPAWGQENMAKKIAFGLTERDKNYQVCFMDLLNITSKTSFLNLLREKALQFTKVEKFSTMMDELLFLPEKIAKHEKFKLLICINNFQNLARFRESEALKKEMMLMNKKRKNCVYLLYGHKSEAMKAIFQTLYRPMIGFGRLYILQAPNLQELKTNISEFFFNSGKRITEEALHLINSKTRYHPYHAALLATQAWWRTQFICTEQIVWDSLEGLVAQFSYQYQILLDQLTIKQIKFLKALLNQAHGFCSKVNLQNYDLGRSSNVSRVRTSLEKKELIYSFHGETFFTDPFLRYWLANYYFDSPR